MVRIYVFPQEAVILWHLYVLSWVDSFSGVKAGLVDASCLVDVQDSKEALGTGVIDHDLASC